MAIIATADRDVGGVLGLVLIIVLVLWLLGGVPFYR